MKILFNEIAPKCIFSVLRALGVTYFFNIVALGGGVIKFLIIKWGGHKNIAKVLLEIYDPPLPKKMVAPLLEPVYILFGFLTHHSNRPVGFLAPSLRKPLYRPVGFKGLTLVYVS